MANICRTRTRHTCISTARRYIAHRGNRGMDINRVLLFEGGVVPRIYSQLMPCREFHHGERGICLRPWVMESCIVTQGGPLAIVRYAAKQKWRIYPRYNPTLNRKHTIYIVTSSLRVHCAPRANGAILPAELALKTNASHRILSCILRVWCHPCLYCATIQPG